MEEDVVVQVVGLAFTGGNAVDIQAGEGRYGIGEETGRRSLRPLRGGRRPSLDIAWLDVAAGKEPAIEPSMMDQQEAFVVGGKDESGAGDVAGSELRAGEGGRGEIEEQQNEFAGFGGGSVGGVRESADERGYG